MSTTRPARRRPRHLPNLPFPPRWTRWSVPVETNIGWCGPMRAGAWPGSVGLKR